MSGVSDLGVAVGNTPGSATSYTTYDVTTGATKIVDFGPTGEYGVAIGGINSSGAIAATALTTVQGKRPKTACRPFEQFSDGSYNWLANSGVNGLVADGLTDNGVTVMSKICGIKVHLDYFLYTEGHLRKFRIPGATGVGIDFVNGVGFGGAYYNANHESVGFTSTGKNLRVTSYATPPGSAGISIFGIGPHNNVAGYSVDPSGYFHGFIYANKTYHSINYPHRKSTIITGFSATGAIIGYFGDEQNGNGLPNQPFIATCPSEKGCNR